MSKINNVLLVGGTHGNERTGATLVLRWQKQKNLFAQYDFNVDLLLANAKAYDENRRYIDHDLNRSFSQEFLEKPSSGEYERQRAHEIIKQCQPHGSAKYDVIIDLHTTTANMGISIILTQINDLNLSIAAKLTHSLENTYCYSWIRENIDEGFLCSLAPVGFAIEIGPIAQGILNADIFMKMQRATFACLDYLQAYNNDNTIICNRSLNLYEHVVMIDYPRDNHNNMTAMIHPHLQNRDYQPLKKGDPIFMSFDEKTITWQGENDLYPIFINEAAYYEKGIAFSVACKNMITTKKD